MNRLPRFWILLVGLAVLFLVVSEVVVSVRERAAKPRNENPSTRSSLSLETSENSAYTQKLKELSKRQAAAYESLRKGSTPQDVLKLLADIESELGELPESLGQAEGERSNLLANHAKIRQLAEAEQSILSAQVHISALAKTLSSLQESDDKERLKSRANEIIDLLRIEKSSGRQSLLPLPLLSSRFLLFGGAFLSFLIAAMVLFELLTGKRRFRMFERVISDHQKASHTGFENLGRKIQNIPEAVGNLGQDISGLIRRADAMNDTLQSIRQDLRASAPGKERLQPARPPLNDHGNRAWDRAKREEPPKQDAHLPPTPPAEPKSHETDAFDLFLPDQSSASRPVTSPPRFFGLIKDLEERIPEDAEEMTFHAAQKMLVPKAEGSGVGRFLIFEDPDGTIQVIPKIKAGSTPTELFWIESVFELDSSESSAGELHLESPPRVEAAEGGYSLVSKGHARFA